MRFCSDCGCANVGGFDGSTVMCYRCGGTRSEYDVFNNINYQQIRKELEYNYFERIAYDREISDYVYRNNKPANAACAVLG